MMMVGMLGTMVMLLALVLGSHVDDEGFTATEN